MLLEAFEAVDEAAKRGERVIDVQAEAAGPGFNWSASDDDTQSTAKKGRFDVAGMGSEMPKHIARGDCGR